MKKFFALFLFCTLGFCDIVLGIEHLFENPKCLSLIKNKKVAVLTHGAAIDKEFTTTVDLFLKNKHLYTLKCFFSPEHGINGQFTNNQKVGDEKIDQINVFSLHGAYTRPTKEMLEDIEVIVCDLQDIGSRSYTYINTLFFVMEEAARRNILVIICDRPNPLGDLIDGPMLEDSFRSIVGYINVPYCHGMTIGELALFFNHEYGLKCQLKILPMTGYRRNMCFYETGRFWIPTSPHIPEHDTPFYYPLTGLIGELQIVNIGVGYTLPFKLIGAPWINAYLFAKTLNAQKIKGLYFQPKVWVPFYGDFKGKECHGVQIFITDSVSIRPVHAQYLILSVLKSMYPQQMEKALSEMAGRKAMFCKVTGTEQIYHLLLNEKYPGWKMAKVHKKEREKFIKKRKRFLIKHYD
jgi:uncharacterized protein YbbC (DUF1343 family)